MSTNVDTGNPNRIVYRWYNDDESTRYGLRFDGHTCVMVSADECYNIDVLRPEYAEAMVTLAAALEHRRLETE